MFFHNTLFLGIRFAFNRFAILYLIKIVTKFYSEVRELSYMKYFSYECKKQKRGKMEFFLLNELNLDNNCF